MGLFSFMKSRFIDMIEWTDTSSQAIVHLIPIANKLIKMGATLSVRESQVAVVVNEGKVADVFESGKYILSQENLPIISAQRLWKSGFKSAFKASVYYVTTKQFTDTKWETVNPIMIKTPDFGDIRVKANGTFTFRVMNVEKFMKEIFGTNQIYDTSYIIGQLKSKLIAGLTDLLNETRMSVTDFASHYDVIGENTENKLQEQFAAYGLELYSFIIECMIVPEEMGSAAPSVKKVNASEIVNINMAEEEIQEVSELTKCQDCGHTMMSGMKFCSECGAKARQEYPCSCGYMLNPMMKYCPDCGVKL